MADSKYPAYTVSSLTTEIAAKLKTFGPIVLEGEISGWRVYASGHAYFTLKDAGAQMQAVFFASDLSRTIGKIGDVLKDGAKVELFGTVSVYANRGNYQFVARSARLAGIGDLMRRYLELKARLEGEGLFDRSKKRPLPSMPRRIGIVTSESGAVIHDMCTVLTRRFPALEIRLYPCLVQGDGAAETVVAGIEYFNACADWRADVLIVARGGGSFEDLFCFNDESLVRAVAASEIVTISAVGHETDYTLCDFAADMRAGTPSIAAEMAVPRLDELKARLADLSASLPRALRAKGEYCAQRIDHLSDGLASALVIFRERLERRLERASVKLHAYSPYGVLERGYSLTTAEDGSVVKDAASIKDGDTITTRFREGSVRSVVKK